MNSLILEAPKLPPNISTVFLDCFKLKKLVDSSFFKLIFNISFLTGFPV